MAIFSKKEETKEDAQYQVDASSGTAPKTSTILVPSILVQPRISEKSGKLVTLNKYVFKVQSGANKVEVKKAVESAYKVRVTQVNIVNNHGKARNFGSRAGRISGFKKAIVTLKKGDTIAGLTDGV
jgi:large subunit ribosomal protein L23